MQFHIEDIHEIDTGKKAFISDTVKLIHMHTHIIGTYIHINAYIFRET